MGKLKVTKKVDVQDEEPRYTDISSRKRFQLNQRQPWQTLEPGSLQQRLLNTCNKNYYSTRQEKEWLDDIASSCRSISEGPSTYPLEWVNEMVVWVEGKRAKGDLLGIPALIGAIKNESRMQDFLAKKARDEWRNSSRSSKSEQNEPEPSPLTTTAKGKTRPPQQASLPGEPPLE